MATVRRKAIRPGQSYRTGDRYDTQSQDAADYITKQVENFLGEHEETLDELTTSRIMPVNSNHYAYWPCNDAAGLTTLHQEVAGGPGALACGSAVAPGYIGLVQESCCLVSSGSGANYRAETTATAPAASGVTVALWLRAGHIDGGHNGNVFGWTDSVGGLVVGMFRTGVAAHGWLYQHSVRVTVGGVTYDALASIEFNTASGCWHHLGLTYDGETLVAYVDGNPAATNTTPSGAISWTTGAGTKYWRLGSDAVESFGGFVHDIRVINGPQPAAWFAEAYRRGVRAFYG